MGFNSARITVMKRLGPLRIISEGLLRITLPPLARPPVEPTEEPAEGLVNWGARHYLTFPRSPCWKRLIQIFDAENISSAFMVCRTIFKFINAEFGPLPNPHDWRTLSTSGQAVDPLFVLLVRVLNRRRVNRHHISCRLVAKPLPWSRPRWLRTSARQGRYSST